MQTPFPSRIAILVQGFHQPDEKTTPSGHLLMHLINSYTKWCTVYYIIHACSLTYTIIPNFKFLNSVTLTMIFPGGAASVRVMDPWTRADNSMSRDRRGRVTRSVFKGSLDWRLTCRYVRRVVLGWSNRLSQSKNTAPCRPPRPHVVLSTYIVDFASLITH